MAQRVAGEQYESITGQLFEIGRQLRQKGGYPFDSGELRAHLQMAIEGRFGRYQAIEQAIEIDVTESFSPTKFFGLGEGWNVWRGSVKGEGLCGEKDMDKRSLGISLVDPNRILLEICLKENENRIVGEKKLLRLESDPEKIRLGGNIFLGFWKDYKKANGKNSALEWLYRELGVIYLDFFGLVLRSPNGSRNVLYFCHYDGGGWRWGCRWLGYNWSAVNPSACLASARS